MIRDKGVPPRLLSLIAQKLLQSRAVLKLEETEATGQVTLT